MIRSSFLRVCGSLALAMWLATTAVSAKPEKPAKAEKPAKPAEKAAAKPKPEAPKLEFPPKLPGGEEVVTDKTDEFLKRPATIAAEVAVAKTAPVVDFAYYPGQTYPGKIWSVWGDSITVGDKYYGSLGDHDAPQGNAFVYEYDPSAKKFKKLLDVAGLLKMPEGHYVPSKIHSRLDMGDDGWIYCGTHRGSTSVTTDQYHYEGDWILRCNPQTGASEVVVRGPVPKHCIPCSVLDPKRLIFYGATAAGVGKELESIHFFAYDIKAGKVLYAGPNGPSRYMLFSKSTGRVYFMPGQQDEGALMCYDPEKGGAPFATKASLGARSATEETPQGLIYTISNGQGKRAPTLWSFNVKTEEVKDLGPANVGTATYVTSLDADPTGRYLYYVPGAHGGADVDGSPVVQFDVQTKQKKVIAFLHPYYLDKYGFTLRGTFSTAVSPTGDKLYITWNISRGSKAWDCVGLTTVHIPESERQP